MPEAIVLEVDSEPVHGWHGPCVDPVAAQLAMVKRRDLSTPGLLGWIHEDDCNWRVAISAERAEDEFPLSATELHRCWNTAQTHPLGWALRALDQIVVQSDHELIVRTLNPVVDLPARLEAVWLWPDLPLEGCSIRELPGNRGVMFSSGRDRDPLILLRTDRRREGLRLWESGHIHATSTTGHNPSDLSMLRSREEWREDRTEIAGVVFIRREFANAEETALLSHGIDRSRLVDATGDMADALFDAAQIHLPLEARDSGMSGERSTSAPSMRRQQSPLPLIHSGFPPNDAVCTELAAQLTQLGLSCFPKELPWGEYLEVLRRKDWYMIFALIPAPWSGPLALTEAMARMTGDRDGSLGQSFHAFPLFTLRSGTLLREPISNAILERWGGLKFWKPNESAISPAALPKNTLEACKKTTQSDFR